MNRAYYSSTIDKFLCDDPNLILGELTRNHQFALEDLQRNAWISQINILQEQLKSLPDSYIAFEYTIPRMGKRVDVVILYMGIVFLLEFKVGKESHSKSSQNQVMDYALDLKYFHENSYDKIIVPIVVSTEAPKQENSIVKFDDGVYKPIKSNSNDFIVVIKMIIEKEHPSVSFDPYDWINSIYKPTPTIIQAAQALYKGHKVEAISRSDSGAINLSMTTKIISNIIDFSKRKKRKSICFVSGVPGAGKTLAGLNIANERHNFKEEEHAVFLSGNGSLVEVLQESLARNDVQEKRELNIKYQRMRH